MFWSMGPVRCGFAVVGPSLLVGSISAGCHVTKRGGPSAPFSIHAAQADRAAQAAPRAVTHSIGVVRFVFRAACQAAVLAQPISGAGPGKRVIPLGGRTICTTSRPRSPVGAVPRGSRRRPGLVTSPAKPPALPERIKAVLRLREQGSDVIGSPWGTARPLKEITMSQDHNHLNHADMGVQVHAEVPQGRAATSFRRSGRGEEMIRAYIRN